MTCMQICVYVYMCVCVLVLGIMSSSQKYCLKWNDYHSSVTSVFEALRLSGELVDISLCCEGRTVKAHKILLSACSVFFRNLFKSNPCQHPVFFLKGPTFSDLSAILEFIYRGEVNVGQEQLNSFLETAELLQVKGLSQSSEKNKSGAKCESSVKTDTSADTAESTTLTHSSTVRPLPRLTPRPPSPRQFPAFSASTSSSPPAAKRRRSPSSLRDAEGSDEQRCAPASPSLAVEEEERLVDESSLDARMEQVEVETEEEGEEEEDVPDSGDAVASSGRHHNNSSNSNSVGASSTATTTSGEWDSRRGAFRCPYCGRLYTHLVSLGQHLKVHQGDTTCHLCGKVLSRTTQLRIHLRQIHGVFEQPSNSNNTNNSGGGATGGEPKPPAADSPSSPTAKL